MSDKYIDYRFPGAPNATAATGLATITEGKGEQGTKPRFAECVNALSEHDRNKIDKYLPQKTRDALYAAVKQLQNQLRKNPDPKIAERAKAIDNFLNRSTNAQRCAERHRGDDQMKLLVARLQRAFRGK